MPDKLETPRALRIDDFLISDTSDCYVIAEIGHNHQGSLEQAHELFDEAKACGAHAVKLQKRDNRSLYTRELLQQRPYENENSYGATYGEHREALEFGQAEYEDLKAHAAELGVTFFATAFDIPSADFLAELDMPLYKIASADLINTPLLKHVAKIGKPMILSTGGATLEDVRARLRGGRRDQPAGRDPAVHGRLPGGVGGARPARHHDLPRSVPATRSSGSPATTTGSRWRSPPTCSARASSRSTSRSTAR